MFGLEGDMAPPTSQLEMLARGGGLQTDISFTKRIVLVNSVSWEKQPHSVLTDVLLSRGLEHRLWI